MNQTCPQVSRTQKTLSEVYEILKVSRSMSTVNTHPLSSMLNRNLRVFETIRNQTNKETVRQIANLEKTQDENQIHHQSLFTARDYKIYHASSRFLIMGLSEPQKYFKTVYNGLEKVCQNNQDMKRFDLEFDDKKRIVQRKSTTGWLHVNSSSSEQKLQETIPMGHKKRPSSVSSSGLAGGKGSGRSAAETHSTTIVKYSSELF